MKSLAARKILLPVLLLIALSVPHWSPTAIASHDDGVNGTVSVYLEILPQALWHTAAVQTPYGAFIFGGVNNAGTIVDTIVKFEDDPPDATTQTAKFPVALHSASAVWDGTSAYIFGGTTAAGLSDRIYRFDPTAPTASQVSELTVRMPEPRTATAAVWDGMRAYVMGGFDTDESSEILEFDPAGPSIQPAVMTLPSARSHASAVWTGAMAILFGGKDASGNPTTDIYRFDPRASMATASIIFDDLPRPLHSTAAVWSGDRAIVLGGRNDVEASRDVYVYDPLKRSMFDTELDGRREAPSAVFKNGHVDLFGGRNNTAVSTWIQKYTPPLTMDADPEYEVMLNLPPDASDAKIMADIARAPKCEPTPVTRITVDTLEAVAALELSCPDYSELVPGLEDDVGADFSIDGHLGQTQSSESASATYTGCTAYPSPGSMTQRTRMWMTVYVDKGFASNRDEVAEASNFQAFWTTRSDGRLLDHVYQPKFPSCIRYVLPVPSSINGGDITNVDQLKALRAYENRFSTKGQEVIVLGWDKIYVPSAGRWANGYKAGGTVSDASNLPAAYFHYPEGSAFAGYRTGIHELGHTMGIGHTDCTTSMAGGHNWLHIMAFSADRHSSCKWYDYHWHWIFKGPDAGAINNKHLTWCSNLRGSSCPA